MFVRLYSNLIQRSMIVGNTLRLHSTATSSCTTYTWQTSPKGRTPTGKLDDDAHPDAEKQPLKPWPNNVNPHTGEINGPSGPEPTRYGDWERKGKCVDF